MDPRTEYRAALAALERLTVAELREIALYRLREIQRRVAGQELEAKERKAVHDEPIH